jgi:hypothetical protein
MGELNTRTDFAQEPSCCSAQNFMFSLRYASRILKHAREKGGALYEEDGSEKCQSQIRQPLEHLESAQSP